MSNILQVNNLVALEALRLLKNNMVLANMVNRGYEKEFDNRTNGYTPGETVTIRKPALFDVRIGNVSAPQDVIEGSTSITVNRQIGCDVNFTGVDLTLRTELSSIISRFMKSQMIKLADQVDRDLFALFTEVNNWVGTPGAVLGTWDSFAAGTERLNNLAVPAEERYACLSPRDKRGMVSAIVGTPSIFVQDDVKSAYRRGRLGMVDEVDTYMGQNVATLTTGTRTNGTNNSGVPTTYLASKDTGTQTLPITGLGANATIAAGEVFTLAGVFDVNPISKDTLPHLKQFVVTTAATATAGGAATVTIRPAMILTGAYKNISAAPAAAAVLTWSGAASTNFRQNMIFHKDAFALVIVPMIEPPGAVTVSRMSMDGISVRSIPYYDGVNDSSTFRLDLLYGVKTVDERLATRISGA